MSALGAALGTGGLANCARDGDVKSIASPPARSEGSLGMLVESILGSKGVVSIPGGCPAMQRNGDLATHTPTELDAGNPPQIVVAAGANAPGDGGGGVFYWDTDSVSDDDGGTILNPQSNCSAPGRWIRVYSGPLDARWFGAVGDGDSTTASRNTIAINNAMRAVRITLAGSTGVHVPAGTYILDGTLGTLASVSPPIAYVPENCELFGDGRATVLQWTATFTGAGIMGANSPDTTASGQNLIRDLVLINTNPSSTGGATGAGLCGAIEYWGGNDIRVRHVCMFGWKYGIVLSQSEDVHVAECSFAGCPGAVSISAQTSIWLTHTRGGGTITQGTNGIAIDNCSFQGPGVCISTTTVSPHSVTDCVVESPVAIAVIRSAFSVVYSRIITADGQSGPLFRAEAPSSGPVCFGLTITDSFFAGSPLYPLLRLRADSDVISSLTQLRISNVTLGQAPATGAIENSAYIFGSVKVDCNAIPGSRWADGDFQSNGGICSVGTGTGVDTANPHADVDIKRAGTQLYALSVRGYDSGIPQFTVSSSSPRTELVSSRPASGPTGHVEQISEISLPPGSATVTAMTIQVPMGGSTLLFDIVVIDGNQTAVQNFVFKITALRTSAGSLTILPLQLSSLESPRLGVISFPMPQFRVSSTNNGIQVMLIGIAGDYTNWCLKECSVQRAIG